MPGYFDDEVIEATLARDVNLLCPEGKWPAKTKEDGLFHKSTFGYDTYTDSYRCSAGRTLILLSRCATTPRIREHGVYGSANCGDCHLRENCTKAAQGRRIKRYPEDVRREALCLVMQATSGAPHFQPTQSHRQPVFSSLRCQQGLNRFRRGLQAVKREFALHVMAHNLSRAVTLPGALFAIFTLF